MNGDKARRIAAALLYAGHMLYTRRSSAIKPRGRESFGSLFPYGFTGEPYRLQAECLLRGPAEAEVGARVRFLHIAHCGDSPEAIEREAAPGIFRFGAGSDGTRSWKALRGRMKLMRLQVAPRIWRVTVEVENRSPVAADTPREEAQKSAFASTHVLLEARGGEFVSLVDPPEALRAAAAACRNEGLWPVLIGAGQTSDTVLCAPLLLDDDPQIASVSPGNLYDVTEIG